MTDNEREQMLPEGTLLKEGEYRVVGYLASGGFGNTYEVEHNGRLHKHMAVKEFFMRGVNTRQGTCVTVSVEDNRKDYERMQRKFFTEAERLAQLDHPHIVEVIDFFEENKTAYYVMKLIDGKPLNKVMLHGPMDTVRVRNILKQVLSALKYVHAQKLYHLDLKPGNIMQNAEGHCWLIDFGASKQMSDDDGHTLTTTALPYTPRYAPLEQVGQNMEDIGPWTDFYALGATLYHLLTAQMPPKPDKVNEDGEAAFSFPAGMDATMRQLILWMMQPRRAQRPQNVEEIEQWLSKLSSPLAVDNVESAGEPVDSNPTRASDATKVSTATKAQKKDISKPTRLSKSVPSSSSRSKKPWLWVAACIVMTLVLVIVLMSRNSTEESDSSEEMKETSSEIFISCPDNNHPHAIDLGLPSGTKWACCNIGAMAPENYGDYFRWGETTPIKEDTYRTYPYEGVDIGDNISGTRYDAAKAQWGNHWRMPTEKQFKELMNNCSFTWTTRNGVNGAVIEGRNGCYIFIPASGILDRGSGLGDVGSGGGYWSASGISSGSSDARNLYFGSSNWYWSNGNRRYYGLPVRAVAE